MSSSHFSFLKFSCLTAAALAIGVSPSFAANELSPRTSFEAYFVQTQPQSALILSDGRLIAEKLSIDGTFGDSGDKQLQIEGQRRAYNVIAAGVASTDKDRYDLKDKGLRALDWGFAQAGDDGSFPGERNGTKKKQYSLHPKSEFIEAAARSMILLQEAGVDQPFQNRLYRLGENLHKSATWMANSQDLVDFFNRANNTNQLMFIATGLQEAGVVTNDPALTAKAQQLMQIILQDHFQSDGTFPEKGSFDSNYQTVSLELFARYISTLDKGPWRDTTMEALRKATYRFLAQVDANGVIDTGDNTRTKSCGEAVGGDGAKGHDIDIIPLRLYYIGYLLNDQHKLADIAGKVQQTGQSFTHDEKCQDGKQGKSKKNK